MTTGALWPLALVVHFSSLPGDAEEQALLSACTRALSVQRDARVQGDEAESCVAADSARADEKKADARSLDTASPTSALKTQAFLEGMDQARVSVEVRVTGPSAVHTSAREVAFRPEDDPLQRARSLGLTIGVLARLMQDEAAARAGAKAGAASGAVTASNVDPEEPSKDQSGEATQASKEQDPRATSDRAEEDGASAKTSSPDLRTGWILGGAVGSDYDAGFHAASFSSELGGAYFFVPRLALSARAFGNVQPSSQDRPRLTYLGGTLGLGARFGSEKAYFLLEPAIGFEQVRTRLPSGDSVQEPSATQSFAARAVPIARLSGEFYGALSDEWRVSLGPAFIVPFSRTRVYVDDTLIGTSAAVRVGARLGLHYSFE